MTAIARTEPPYTVDSLAKRWGCSPGMIRKRIKSGEIRVFRLGALIRIPSAEVERFESLNTVTDVSAAEPPSSNTTATESDTGRSLMRPIGLRRRHDRA